MRVVPAPCACVPVLLQHSDPLILSLASLMTRESKELVDFARIHPSSCATNGLNSNLMVTGGPALAGSGRWSTDPASHLAAHPWLPRTGSPSMWLAGHPYGECPRGTPGRPQQCNPLLSAQGGCSLTTWERERGCFGASKQQMTCCVHPLGCDRGVSSSRTWPPIPAPGHDSRLPPCHGRRPPFCLPVCQRPAVGATCRYPQ